MKIVRNDLSRAPFERVEISEIFLWEANSHYWMRMPETTIVDEHMVKEIKVNAYDIMGERFHYFKPTDIVSKVNAELVINY